MKTKIISKILFALGLVLVLGSAIMPVHGGTQPGSASVIDSPDQQLPVVSIHSVNPSGFTGNTGVVTITRGQTGVFVLSMTPQILLNTIFVNFTVSGTAIAGVDYVPFVSPAFIGHSGFGVILVKTLPRASDVRQAESVVVTLEPGPGYTLGTASSAEILIKP
jgi:hypothetical protein